MNILIAVDDTSESLDAVHTAYRLFGEAASYTVTSVESVGTPALPMTPGGMSPAFLALDDMFEAALVRATSTATEATDELAADAEIVPETGPAGAAICRTAGTMDADVIVIGSHDRSVWRRLLTPSVGRYVIENAPCPVLVVR